MPRYLMSRLIKLLPRRKGHWHSTGSFPQGKVPFFRIFLTSSFFRPTLLYSRFTGASLRRRSTSSVGGINPTTARRFGHPMAGTPLTPTLSPSSMKASTVGENRRSFHALSTSEAEMSKRSVIGTMTSRFEISACSVKNARETSWQKAPASRSPFWARTSSAVSSAKREFTLCCGGSIGSPTS
jgi:hypothetical protein